MRYRLLLISLYLTPIGASASCTWDHFALLWCSGSVVSDGDGGNVMRGFDYSGKDLIPEAREYLGYQDSDTETQVGYIPPETDNENGCYWAASGVFGTFMRLECNGHVELNGNGGDILLGFDYSDSNISSEARDFLDSQDSDTQLEETNDEHTNSSENNNNGSTWFGDVLTGDTKLACEAKLCLTAVGQKRPSECQPSIDEFNKRMAKNAKEAREWLNSCPDGDDGEHTDYVMRCTEDRIFRDLYIRDPEDYWYQGEATEDVPAVCKSFAQRLNRDVTEQRDMLPEEHQHLIPDVSLLPVRSMHWELVHCGGDDCYQDYYKPVYDWSYQDDLPAGNSVAYDPNSGNRFPPPACPSSGSYGPSCRSGTSGSYGMFGFRP